MVKCGICGGEAPRQPGITDEGTCDICGKKVMLAHDCLHKIVKNEKSEAILYFAKTK
jgi:DNA-directed RNA polymerase subunit RPC12/RpoP